MFIYVALFMAALYAFIFYLEKTTVFQPSKVINETPKNINIDYEDVYFFSSDRVKLNGWFIKAPQGKYTFLFAHGNAGNISHRVGKIKALYDMGINVFIFDYRGYGKSRGRPSEKGMYSDTLAAYEYLKSRKDVDQDRIVAYGVSLGGVAAIDIASKRPFNGLIVESTFSSAKDMAKVIFPFLPGFLVRAELNSAEKIKRIKIPTLFMHSVNDEMVPFELGKKLYNAASMPKKFVALEGGHNDNFIEDDEKYNKAIFEFLDEYLK